MNTDVIKLYMMQINTTANITCC